MQYTTEWGTWEFVIHILFSGFICSIYLLRMFLCVEQLYRCNRGQGEKKKKENLRPTTFLHTVSHSPLSPVGNWWETVYLRALCFLFFFDEVLRVFVHIAVTRRGVGRQRQRALNPWDNTGNEGRQTTSLLRANKGEHLRRRLDSSYGYESDFKDSMFC